MKKILFLAIACIMVLSCFTAVVSADGAEKIPATFLYVAVDGSDSASGAADAPFATLAKAVEAAKAIDGTVVINVKGGEYALGDTIALTEADNDLVIRAMPGEKVVMTGGKKIKFEDFVKETDTELLKKIVTGNARAKVITADLAALGITELGEVANCGFGIASSYAPSLTYNDRYLTIAQYPNGKDYLYTGDIIDDGSKNERTEYNGGFEVKFTVKDSRWNKWADAKDIWAIGWYIHDWAESITPATIDFESGVVSTTSGYNNIKSDRRVKFFNLFEELDEAGEYYIDREAKKLYLIAPDGFKKGESLVFSAHNKDIITLKGCENITIQGIRFEGTTERGIYGTNCKNVVIDGCELTAIGRDAVKFEEDSRECIIKNCYIHDVGSSGATVNGGDKPTLTKGNNAIENCHIERFMQYKLTYASAVNMYGVGNRISNCEINDGPHQGANYSGVYNVFEYNNIYRVCTDSSDCGAIYTGRNWADRNNEIRHNYFHDLKMIDTTAGMEMQAVYLDDMHSSTFVYGNVFYKVDSIALFGGGRDNTFENNLMLDSAKPFVFDARGTDWMDTSSNSPIYNNLINSPWETEVWKEAFPTMATILTDRTKEPVGNVIKNNLIYNTPAMNLNPLVAQNGTVEATLEVKTSDFVDYGKDFRVKEDSEIFTKLPEFKQIEWEKMGRYDYTLEDKWEDNGNAPAAPETPAAPADGIKVLLNGEAIDFADVAPQIINDRTMVPLRAIFEALGAEVAWDDATKTVTAKKDDVTIKMTIGADSFTRNDESVALDSPATIVDSRTLVPVRAIAESFGSKVDWIAESKTVTIED